MKRALLAVLFVIIYSAVAHASALILFNEEKHDFGDVQQGDKLEYEFSFKNIGDETLIIKKITASWGCTVAMVSSDHLGPDEEGIIKATIDTRRKKGRIVKTIQVMSNDPERPLVVLRIFANVKDPFHGTSHEPDAIFRTPCRNCHVERGTGATGAALFRADCMMCHRRGRIGEDLTKLKKLSYEELRYSIEKGVQGTVMPGFSAGLGGPLTQTQIRSLIRYIKNH